MTNKQLVLSLLAAPAAIVYAMPADKPTTDDYINDTVKQKLAADTVVKGGGLDISVKDGVVTLSGKVSENRQKDKAGSIAKKVHGVKSVINNIKVEKL